jgi:hypothetical protein
MISRKRISRSLARQPGAVMVDTGRGAGTPARPGTYSPSMTKAEYTMLAVLAACAVAGWYVSLFSLMHY